MMPLSWRAQLAAHAAYVEARRIEVAAPPAPRSAYGRCRSPDAAQRNRDALLQALRDRHKHPFADLRAALPHLSSQGIYYLVEALKTEGHLDYTAVSRTNRRYFLT